MPHYTLFALEPRSGRMNQFAKYEAPDDDIAAGLAARLSKRRSIELWSEHRHLGTFESAANLCTDRQQGRL